MICKFIYLLNPKKVLLFSFSFGKAFEWVNKQKNLKRRIEVELFFTHFPFSYFLFRSLIF